MSGAGAGEQPELWNEVAYRGLSDIGTMVSASSRRFGAETFLDPVEADFAAVSFNDVARFVRGLGVLLEQRGVQAGDSCAVIANNGTTLALQFIGIMAAGRVFVPINPNSSADEMSFILGDCRARLVLYDGALEEKVSFLSATHELVPFADDGSFLSDVMALADHPLRRPIAATGDSTAEIVYTTGTTGRPKGVKLSHRNLLADMFGIGQVFGFAPRTRFMTITPLFHNSGQIMTTLIPLYCGGITTAIRPDMGFISFWHFVDRFEPAWTLVMPSHVALMLDRKESPEGRSLQGILCGGAKLERATHLAFESRFNVPIYPNYGLTESASIATCARPDDTDRASGSVGRALDINRVRVFVANREAGAGEVGEIRISGDNVFGGYLNLESVYADKVQNGWLHTGDLGYADASGYVHIVDRIDNMILVGGENVYPTEVERFVPELEGVSEAFLLSIPDRIMGRELVLVYRLLSGREANAKAWKALLYEKIVRFKVPRRFIDVHELGLDDFPRSPSGKLLRKKLQNALEHHLCPAPDAPPARARTSRELPRVAAAIATVTGLDEGDVHEGLVMDTVPSWDSMAHLRLMVMLEETFNVSFSPGEMASLTSVRAILDALSSRGEGSRA